MRDETYDKNEEDWKNALAVTLGFGSIYDVPTCFLGLIECVVDGGWRPPPGEYEED